MTNDCRNLNSESMDLGSEDRDTLLLSFGIWASFVIRYSLLVIHGPEGR